MKRFNIRTSKPGKDNKEYIRKASGGWSSCVKGKPTDKNCDAIANCVGYACGRFGEIINEILGTTGLKYSALNCNAENFIERAKSLGLEVVDYPVLGGIMVMQKGATLSGNDGAGHVFIVEDIYESNHIYTSESGYGSSAFWNSHRYNTNGRWGHSSAYSFRGCIVNPAVGKVTSRNKDDEPTPAPTPQTEWPKSHTVVKGDTLSGIAQYYYGNGDKTHYMFIANANGIADPNIIHEGQKLTIPEYKETPAPAPSTGLKEGDKVVIKSTGNANSYGTGRTAYGIGWTRTILKVWTGRKYPYQVGNSTGTTGFYKAEALQKK